MLAAAACGTWIYLAIGRGRFWLGAENDGPMHRTLADVPTDFVWPSVVAVVPARNEAELIGTTLPSLLAQQYPGAFSVVLVDDHSDDGTAHVALQAAAAAGYSDRLSVIQAPPLPAGWTGKLWAVAHGVSQAGWQAGIRASRQAGRQAGGEPDVLPDTQAGGHAGGDAGVQPSREIVGNPPDYLLLTDADICYRPQVLAALVHASVTQRRVLSSLMVRLHCRSLVERAFIPAFVFFFQMIYPFAWVNRPGRATAAAAGGCMLVNQQALTNAGGLESIRSAIIDDCALGRRMKQMGPIHLALGDRLQSLRPCSSLDAVRAMVVRSAYAQLGYSMWLLAFVVAAMAAIFVAPVVLAIIGGGATRALAMFAWLLMAIIFSPIARRYRVSIGWGLALPGIALIYLIFTVESAVQHRLGRGGLWKGRVQAHARDDMNTMKAEQP